MGNYAKREVVEQNFDFAVPHQVEKGEVAQFRKVLKLIVVGDRTVGKTSIIKRYMNHGFSDWYKGTIGADLFTTNVEVLNCGNKQTSLQIWDTSGDRQYMPSAILNACDGVLLVFDLTRKETFYNLEKHMEFFLHSSDEESARDPNQNFVLVGNKADCEKKELVKFGEIMKLTEKHRMRYFEVSSRTGRGIFECFEGILRLIMKLDVLPEKNEIEMGEKDEKERILSLVLNNGFNNYKKNLIENMNVSVHVMINGKNLSIPIFFVVTDHV